VSSADPVRAPSPGGAVLRLDSIRHVFQARGETVVALDDVSLSVGRGEFVSIVGPSGCGKTTLLNLVVGQQRPTAGVIEYGGERWPAGKINTAIGYVTQDDNLFPWRTVKSNTEFGMEVRNVPRSQRSEIADRLIREVGLDGFERHYRHELSGGMRQRANIIRTLAYAPEVILMDEPFGPLDAQTRIQLQGQLLRLWESRPGTTIVFITHDLAEAIALADRVVVMTKRPGRIKATFDVDLARPRDVYRLQSSPDFHALYERLWRVLEDEVREARRDH
jgi:NitT/TauT family transport system ATP-binding protein